MKKRNKILIVILSLLALLAALSGIFLLSIFYSADETAKAYYTNGGDGSVTVTARSGGESVFLPDDPQEGIIFYPGAGVDPRAYAPLMHDLAREGICCVVKAMPLRLAVFGKNSADGVKEEFPQISRWYMAGHSLGGAVAAMYLKDHSEEYEGLLLLASYSTEDLSQTGLSVLTLYGENDGVLNFSHLEEDKVNLPQNSTMICIPGGNHAQFGDYGAQKGDGTATITAREQQEFTARAITEWMAADK